MLLYHNTNGTVVVPTMEGRITRPAGTFRLFAGFFSSMYWLLAPNNGLQISPFEYLQGNDVSNERTMALMVPHDIPPLQRGQHLVISGAATDRLRVLPRCLLVPQLCFCHPWPAPRGWSNPGWRAVWATRHACSACVHKGRTIRAES
jgi:hypothetical protein